MVRAGINCSFWNEFNSFWNEFESFWNEWIGDRGERRTARAQTRGWGRPPTVQAMSDAPSSKIAGCSDAIRVCYRVSRVTRTSTVRRTSSEMSRSARKAASG